MRIDRGRFLLLTSAIAVGACPMPAKPPPAPNVDPPPRPPTAKVDARPPLWERNSSWWAFPSDPENCLPGGGNWKPPLLCMPMAATCATAANAGAAPPCNIPTKDGCNATLQGTCLRAIARMSPATLPRAVACLVESAEACKGNYGQGPEYVSARCLVGAAHEACVDPSVAATCAKLVDKCRRSDWSPDSCEELFSGLSPEGRAHVESCVLGSKCAVGPAECLALR